MGRSEREGQPAALIFGRMRLLHTADINSGGDFLKPKLFQNGSFLCCNSHCTSRSCSDNTSTVCWRFRNSSCFEYRAHIISASFRFKSLLCPVIRTQASLWASMVINACLLGKPPAVGHEKR